jgi:tryptophanyl-tRNA synthetase
MDDEEKLNQIGENYKSGKMMTSEIKNILIDLLVKLVETH